MEWNDDAIVIGKYRHGENSAIITLLTANHGLHKGFVRGVTNKNNRSIYQLGNIINATWKGRLAEHLGNFAAESTSPTAAFIANNQRKIYALESICNILSELLPERALYPYISQLSFNLIKSLLQDKDNWVNYYTILEYEILSHLGFGIDLSECAATRTTEDLIYVSPKSGRAVSKQAGDPYKEKLIHLPKFMLNYSQQQNITYQIDDAEILQSLIMTRYFMNKELFAPFNKKMPQSRMRFEGVFERVDG